LGIEGTVRLRVLVGADGRVQQARVLSGPGYGLNRAARRALLKFRFLPAIGGKDRRTIPYWITYRCTFRIDD
jgi:protein TonB